MLDELIEKMLTNLKKIVESETVIGKPVQSEETTIIPLTKISLGFGAGSGESQDKKGEGGATGGGAKIEPVAVITVHKDEVKIVNLKKKSTDYSQLMEKIPGIIDKFSKKDKDKSKE